MRIDKFSTYIKYLLYVIKHKYYVAQELYKLYKKHRHWYLLILMITHDLSKFSLSEFRY